MVKTTGFSSMMTQLSEVVGPNRTIAPMIVPPDGGWGWIIVLVGVLGSCCVDGCVYCFYIYRDPMSKDLNIQPSDVSYLSSLITGFYFFGAVLACSFGNHFGFRMTMVLGGIVTSLSYASGYLLQNILYYYILVGVVAGIGSGFISVGANLPASFYFDKKRSIALGIVACGSGLGGIVMPNIVEWFMGHHGWRNTYLFQGGVLATVIITGTLVRPLKPVMVVIEVESSLTTVRPREDSTISAFRAPMQMLGDTLSFISVGAGRSGLQDQGPTQPTIAQMADEYNVINVTVREHTQSNPSVITRLQGMSQIKGTSQSQVLHPSASMANSILISQEPLFEIKRPWYKRGCCRSKYAQLPERPLMRHDLYYTGSLICLPQYAGKVIMMICVVTRYKCGCCRSKYAQLPERPLMRHDLYYTGSLIRLPQYAGKDRDLEYHMNVTRVPTYYQTVQDLTKNYTIWCCHNIFTGLHYLIDYTMFKSLTFICLALCGFGVYIAFYLPYIFSKVHLEELGEGNKASMLVSFIGLGSMCGRLLSGLIITAFPRFDARTVLSVMLLISGVAISCTVLQNDLYYKGACLLVFGFTIGFYLPLRSLIIVDYFGLEKLTSATGVLILCLGFGSFMGPPIVENIMRYTNDKNTPFYVCGVSLVLSSMTLWPMHRISLWEKKRAEKRRQRERRRVRED